MENVKDTQEKEEAAGNPPVTPKADSNLNPDPAQELAELRRKTDELGKQLSDKDRHITDLRNTAETLEARLNQIGKAPANAPVNSDLQAQAKSILETAQIDPETASKELANLIRQTEDNTQKKILENLAPIIEQNTYISKVRENNKDLIDLGLEPSITMRANQLMQSGKQFKEAIDTAVKESKEKVDKIKSNAPPTPPPVSASAETGGNPPPIMPPPEKVVTQEDEINARNEKRRKLGLG